MEVGEESKHRLSLEILGKTLCNFRITVLYHRTNYLPDLSKIWSLPSPFFHIEILKMIRIFYFLAAID